ncbi:hypothetical protein [Bradyrhizobium sp. 173]|uniref:hypothetical protein n=1 Tax=Bradyrhizobium sp. 173 TaxID=2782644 RepID=UPI001FF78488|nr:hypothetical protein [Bradyrhizobium sp. 173]
MILLTQPQPVIQTLDRALLAYVDVGILQRGNRDRIAALLEQSWNRQRFVALLLVQSHQPDGLAEEPVDGGLEIDPHVAGKLADRGHEFAARSAGKVPIENVACKVEILLSLVRGLIRRTHAFAAQPDRAAADTNVGLSLRLATEFARTLDRL